MTRDQDKTNRDIFAGCDEAIALAQNLVTSSSQDWWKTIRDTLHEEFAK